MNDKRNEESGTDDGVEIEIEGPYYSQIPVDLLRDPQIKFQAAGVYGLLHSYGWPKDLSSKPKTFVSQKTLASSGMSTDQLRKWIKVLEAAGWLTIQRRGLNRSNKYTLHAQRVRE